MILKMRKLKGIACLKNYVIMTMSNNSYVDTLIWISQLSKYIIQLCSLLASILMQGDHLWDIKYSLTCIYFYYLQWKTCNQTLFQFINLLLVTDLSSDFSVTGQTAGDEKSKLVCCTFYFSCSINLFGENLTNIKMCWCRSKYLQPLNVIISRLYSSQQRCMNRIVLILLKKYVVKKMHNMKKVCCRFLFTTTTEWS